MSRLLIKNSVLVMEDHYENSDILIDNGKIHSIKANIDDNDACIINADEVFVTPGLIDIHLHGGLECDFLKQDQRLFNKLMNDLLKRGITSIIPTIMTDEHKSILNQFEYIKNQRNLIFPRILGINLEGPFLSPKKNGIHKQEWLKKPEIELVKKYINDFTKIITIAPEMDENFSCIKYLKQLGIVVSIGHSDADYETTIKAIQSGASLATHLYNTMKPFHHRYPGIIGACLTEDSISVEIIADGVHVHPAAIAMAIKCKPKEKIILVSDSVAIRESNKEMNSSGKKVRIIDNTALNEDGIISGSITTIEKEIQNLVHWGLCDFKTAVRYATINPALLMGLKDIGYIRPGNQADLVLWNKETLAVQKTIIKGNLIPP